MSNDNIIRRHAQLSCAIQHFRANGRQAPAHMIHEIQRIESKASATLAAPQLNQAMRASSALQAQMFRARDIQAAQSQARDRAFYTDRAAKQATGFDAGQLQQIAKTGRVTERPKFHAGRAKIASVGIAKQFDKNISLPEWEKLAARVDEMQDYGKDPRAMLKARFGNKSGAALHALNAFNESNIQIAYSLSKDRDKTRTLGEQERSEINLKALSAREDPHALDPPIDPGYLDRPEGDLTGDVARAMEKVEFEEMSKDRENYV